MHFTRARALSLIAAAPLVASCGAGDSVKVGSKSFTEELILGELYAQSLEVAGLRVTRKLNLGTTDIAMAALKRGEIDLYPEAGAVWKGDLAAGDPQGVFGEVLAVLPDPVGIDGGHLAGRRRRDVGEHGK